MKPSIYLLLLPKTILYTFKAIERLKTVPVSLHCWQGDDVSGFENAKGSLSGGIMTTGNYFGKARTYQELMDDIDKVIELVPGQIKMNLHACYAIFDEENGGWADRDKIEPKHFKKWVDYCKERGMGCDFNPTFFSHPKCDPLTLSSPDEVIVSRFFSIFISHFYPFHRLLL